MFNNTLKRKKKTEEKWNYLQIKEKKFFFKKWKSERVWKKCVFFLSLFMSLCFWATFGLVFCLSSDVGEKNVPYLKVCVLSGIITKKKGNRVFEHRVSKTRLSRGFAGGFMIDGRQVVFHRYVRVSLSEWGLQFKWRSSVSTNSIHLKSSVCFILFQCALRIEPWCVWNKLPAYLSV